MITDNVSVVEYYANDTAMETLIPHGVVWQALENPTFNKCRLKGVPPPKRLNPVTEGFPMPPLSIETFASIDDDERLLRFLPL